MKLAIVLCLCAVALAGCGSAAPESNPSPKSPPVPDTARIVCDRDGSRVLTSKVRARPDGVRFEIENRLGKDTGYSVKYSESGMGDNAPKGESRHTGGFPPGEVRIGCYPSLNADPDYAELTVLAGDSGYKPVELECPGGRAVGSAGGLYAPGAKGAKGDPVDLVRRRFSDQLDDGDVVEAAGYPESRDGRTVRAIRDGRVVAVFEYRREESGWLENGYSACEDF